MNRQLGIQVFSVRDHMRNEQDTKETFKKLASYGFTQIQTAGGFDFGVEKYAQMAKEAGLENLKGHRTVGGMRASIYNAMPKEGVEALVAFMKKFEAENVL